MYKMLLYSYKNINTKGRKITTVTINSNSSISAQYDLSQTMKENFLHSVKFPSKHSSQCKNSATQDNTLVSYCPLCWSAHRAAR